MKVLITGGAGFIGCNTANYFLKKGYEVSLFDNFSRKGTLLNLAWLNQKHSKNLKVIHGDIRIDYEKLNRAVERTDIVFHLAAQVAVTTSITNPREDFETNALGTFNILESIRKSKKRPILIYSSTNKVYGRMENIKIVEKDKRYEYRDFSGGIPEDCLLDFHSPYGCSKGSADQYVRDYSRIYDLRTVTLRQSCIYGYRQFGIEDQGWVAWFMIASILNKTITIYGNGKQVRDILFIDDLMEVYDLAIKNIDKTAGNIYNIGGGPQNRLSLLELIDYLEKILSKKVRYKFSEWRAGDQPIFVCNVSKAKRDFGWRPKISVDEGIKRLYKWNIENKRLFS